MKRLHGMRRFSYGSLPIFLSLALLLMVMSESMQHRPLANNINIYPPEAWSPWPELVLPDDQAADTGGVLIDHEPPPPAQGAAASHAMCTGAPQSY
jgi:hypothetical protein